MIFGIRKIKSIYPKGKIGRALGNMLKGLRALRWKLFFSYILISIIPMFILWWNVVSNLEAHLIEQRTHEIRAGASRTALLLNSTDYMDNLLQRVFAHEYMQRLSEDERSRIIVVDVMAMVLFDSLGVDMGNTLATPGIMQALGGTPHGILLDGTNIIEAIPIYNNHGDVVGAVMMVYYLATLEAFIDYISSLTMNFIIFMGIAVAIVVIIIAQWLIMPMRHILTAAKKISQGQLDERIELRSKDEFSDLSIALNDMTDKLAQVEMARQEFVSNVSHELKTPLSSIKVLSESLIHEENVAADVYKEFLGDITSEVDRMTSIVNELLTLVRLDEVELPLNIESFNLNSMIKGVIKRLKPLANQREVKIEYNELKQINIEADEMRISLAISNLVENAIKYNKPMGSVNIILDADNKSAFVSINDTGVGISEENQTKVFTRFFRVDKGRDRETGGTGLGLAITHKAILLHKGSIKLTSSDKEDDSGSSFVVRLPLHHR